MNGTQSSGRNKAVVVTAVGAGVLMLGAAAAFMYHHFSDNKKKLQNLRQEMARLDLAFSELRQEFLALRNSRSSDKSRKLSISSQRNTCSFCSSSAEDELESFTTALDDQDVFYDLDSEEEETSMRTLEDSEDRSSKLFYKVDVLMKGDDKDRLEAFNLLKKHELEMSDNADFLWRYAQAHQKQAAACGALKDMEAKKNYINHGLEYASKALALDDTNPDVNKWFAILTGMQGDFVSIKEKIQNGYKFQKHILIAINSKPEDYSLHHLLGRFKFEIANCTWLERKVAASFFGEIPEVKFSDAITDFLAAEELNPIPWKENRLLLAKCYIGDGKYDKAIHWLDSAREITPKTKEDEACDQETNNLLEKYKKYRK